MISKDGMEEWAIKYVSRNARKSHPDYAEFVRRTKYMINKFYDSIGSCSECKYGMNFEEINAHTKSTEQWTDCKMSNKTYRPDFFCADFEREVR